MNDLRKIKHRKELGHEKFNPNEKDLALELKPIDKPRDDKKKEISIKISLEELIELLHPNSDFVTWDTGDNVSIKNKVNDH